MRRPRGQSVVEASLFLLLFITVVTFGIHFAEVGYLSVKVQEAANSALWDATGRKMHDTFTGKWDHYKSAITFGQNEANRRYSDFNGLSSVNGPARSMVQVFTRANPIDTRCETVPQISLLPHRPASAAIPSLETGMGCTAKATLEGYRFPRWFLQNDAAGFFQAEQKKRPIAVCGAGRQNPQTGKCQGRFVIALDDWGFSGTKERKECKLADDGAEGCENQGYFDLVKKTYRSQVGSAGDAFSTQSSQLAQQVVGRNPLPGDENHFYLSFRGNESKYKENLRVSHGSTRWETTPFSDRQEYREYSATRYDCWLGQDCNR